MNPLSKDIHTFTKYYGSDQIPFVRSGAIQENTSQVTGEIGNRKDTTQYGMFGILYYFCMYVLYILARSVLDYRG